MHSGYRFFHISDLRDPGRYEQRGTGKKPAQSIEANLASEFITGNDMDAIRREVLFIYERRRQSGCAIARRAEESTAHASGDQAQDQIYIGLYEEYIGPLNLHGR
jgi:hypothetical protein